MLAPATARPCMSTEPRRPYLSLLNAFRLTNGSREVALTLPAQRLVAYLALRARPVLRDQAAEELWLDASQEHALGSLRSALWRIRRESVSLVHVRGCCMELAPELDVDVQEAELWARALLRGSAPCGCDLSGLRYSGEILPDWCDDWVMFERERFRLLHVQALEALCHRLITEERLNEALDAGLTAVCAEPLRESAQRALMSVHVAQGNMAEVMDQYRRFRDRLDQELGLAPSPQMLQLVARAHDC
jgi:DNA-binding SARP family transcriptional activator